MNLFRTNTHMDATYIFLVDFYSFQRTKKKKKTETNWKATHEICKRNTHF